MKKLTTDEKIDELAGMVANGFAVAHTELMEVRDELRYELRKAVNKVEQAHERHLKRSEKDHSAFNKRINIIERLQNI